MVMGETCAGAARRRAVVTGASTGIGAAFAQRLAHEQFDVVLVARTRDRLERLATQLQSSHKIAVEVLCADLTRAADLRTVEQKVATDDRLALLINAAGVVTVGCFEQLDVDAEEAEIRLNVLATVRLTRAALPGMISRGHGGIINVSSIAAFVPGRYTATYCATKAFLRSFTEALHEELRGTGVRVQALCPGFTRTELAERSGVDVSKIPSFAWTPPEAVVEAALAGLRRGAVVCVPGVSNRMLTLLLSALPRRLARRLAGAGAKRGWAAHRRRGASAASTD